MKANGLFFDSVTFEKKTARNAADDWDVGCEGEEKPRCLVST